VELLETVGGVLALALTPHCTLLPEPYVATLLHSPLIGQADAAAQMQLADVSDLWSGTSHRVRDPHAALSSDTHSASTVWCPTIYHLAAELSVCTFKCRSSPLQSFAAAAHEWTVSFHLKCGLPLGTHV
jgi:hypothetical protein